MTTIRFLSFFLPFQDHPKETFGALHFWSMARTSRCLHILDSHWHACLLNGHSVVLNFILCCPQYASSIKQQLFALFLGKRKIFYYDDEGRYIVTGTVLHLLELHQKREWRRPIAKSSLFIRSLLWWRRWLTTCHVVLANHALCASRPCSPILSFSKAILLASLPLGGLLVSRGFALSGPNNRCELIVRWRNFKSIPIINRQI